MAFAIAASLAAFVPVQAQRVEGHLLEEGSMAPIVGAFVTGVDSTGSAVAGALTDEGGFFTVQLPDSGTYRLAAHRIGYASSESPELHVRRGETVSYSMSVRTEAVVLSSLEVTAERRCSLVEDAGIALDRIWAEARKAMLVSEWTRRSGALEMKVTDYELFLDPETLEVVDYTSTERAYFGARPYQSLPAEQLAGEGYVVRRSDGTYYFAPDESVLLSDVFLETHCFQARRDPERPNMIGLTFEPMTDRDLPDIEGAFWLDEETAELRFLEYRYSQLLDPVPAPEAGGRVEFRQLPGGAWIVHRWGIIMPEITLVAPRGRGSRSDGRMTLGGYRESGGEVTETILPEEARARRRAVVVGRVEDRETGEPIVGAVVFLSGTQYRTVTGESGRFELRDLPPGSFPLVYRHERLDRLETFARPVQLELTAGQTLEVTLYFPPAN
jgi:hypothetical protein